MANILCLTFLLLFSTIACYPQSNWTSTVTGYLYTNPNWTSVGIGTATPNIGLHIASTTTWGTGIWLDATKNTNGSALTGGKMWVLQSVGGNTDALNGSLFFRNETDNRYVFTLTRDGKAGLGTQTPFNGLHIANNESWGTTVWLDATKSTGGKIWGLQSVGGGHWAGNGSLVLRNESTATDALVIDQSGRVSIGGDMTKVSQGDGKLYVGGKIVSEEIRVKLQGNWPDYVFGKKYNLRTLSELQKYIEENDHLPEVPSAKEVAEDGINVGAMNAVLLKKIEEITLYLLELKEENEELKSKLNKIENKIR